MNKDYELLLAIVIFILVAKNVCGKTREKFSSTCNVEKCALNLCNKVMEGDATYTPQQIVADALDENPLILGLGETISACDCSDQEVYQAALEMNSYEKKQGKCIPMGSSGGSGGSGSSRGSAGSRGSGR